MATVQLKAPFPYFGGKRPVASLVWDRFGDVNNFIEPFCGSAAMLLLRPTPPKIETINDADCYVANFWRATQHDPEAVAGHASWPVNEADLHARHRWLVLSEASAEFRRRMRTDPDYFDARIAGWWCWGLCSWIGSGWCSSGRSSDWEQRPQIDTHDRGVLSLPDKIHAKDLTQKRPILAAPHNEHGERTHQGVGVHSKGPSEKLPRLTGGRRGDEYYGGLGVHVDAVPEPDGKRPQLNTGNSHYGPGVHPEGPSDGNRPQLADAFARGRGVHGNDSAGTCDDRTAWLVDWFGRLRDRLRTVRVCCGDWRRVCDSPSVTTRLGTTGVFFDPPYAKSKGDGTENRAGDLYANDKRQDVDQLVKDVRAYCLERGTDPGMRIALCGYEGEGHEELERAGWSVVHWKANGGYGNRSEKGKENSARERIWFSPHCLDMESEKRPLFALLKEDEELEPTEAT